MSELQADLQRLSGTTLDAAGAANVWAGTAGLELVGALNAKAGTRSLGLNGVLKVLSGTTLDGNGALGAVSSETTITDTFTAADGTNLHGKATTTGGKTWTVGTGAAAYDINTNKARPTVLGGSSAWAVVDSGYANIDMTVTITTGAAGIDGLFFRVVDATNYLRLDINNTGDALHLRQNIAGTEAQIAQVAIAGLAVGNVAVYRVLAVGTSIKIYRDGVLKIDTTSTTHQTATKHGFIAASLNTRFDDFSLARAT